MAKALLKSARTAIQNKKYEEAFENCSAVLKKDPENYNALVFIGLCCAELDKLKESQEYYKKAVKISKPDQLLAYQGLVNLYVKKWDNSKNTTEDNAFQKGIFEVVLSDVNCRKDAQKYCDISLNYYYVLCRLHEHIEALSVAKNLLNDPIIENVDNDAVIKITKAIVSFPSQNKDCEKDIILSYSDTSEKAFLKLIHRLNDNSYKNEAIISYMKFFSIHCHTVPPALQDLCQKLSNIFPCEVFYMKILVLMLLQVETFDHSKLTELCTKIENLDSDYFKLCKGFQLFHEKNWDESYQLIKKLPNVCKNFLPAQLILTKSALNMRDFKNAQELSKVAIAQCSKVSNEPTIQNPWIYISDIKSIKLKFSILLARSLCMNCNMDSITLGIKTFTKLIELNPDNTMLYTGLAEGAIKLKNYELATKSLSNCLSINSEHYTAKVLLAYVNFKKSNDAENALKILDDIMLENKEVVQLASYFIAKIMWETGGKYIVDKTLCFTALVKAAKLDTYNDDIFVMLGRLYKTVLRDDMRAKNCFTKAYNLNPVSEAASFLCDILIKENDIKGAVDIYQTVCDNGDIKSTKWAWLRLGLSHLKENNFKDAIRCFLTVLKSCPEDFVLWECLGEAYLQRGSYMAAWKTFNKANELNQRSVYSLYQMANIKHILGSYDEAITEYRTALKVQENYVPALKGLGESLYYKAKDLMSEGRYKFALSCIKEAILYLTNACKIRKDLSCLWKLIGDCCSLPSSLDKRVVAVNIPEILFKNKTESNDSTGTIAQDKYELLILAVKMYSRAVHLQDKSPAYWHDLGVGQFNLSLESTENQIEIANKAIDFIKMSIKLEPNNHIYWSSLGVVCAHPTVNKKNLAQHCFIKSINLEQNNAIAWVNLGVLYFQASNVQLAHEAFKMSQNIQPSLVNSWIGQAIVAESIGSNESIDLFRHSTELGLHPEGAKGYGYWVCSILKDFDDKDRSLFDNNVLNMNAANTAATQMSKICNRNSSNGWNHYVYGTILEHLGLYKTSAESFKNALTCFENSKKQLNGNEMKVNELADKIKHAKINLIKVSAKSQDLKTCVDIIQSIKLSDFEFVDFCSIALALHEIGMFDKSYEIYKKCGTLATTEEERSNIMVAMAISSYRMKNVDQAKSLLYACFKTCELGLFTLCALSICQKDVTLIGASLKELLKVNNLNNAHCDETKYRNVCILISSAAHIIKKNDLAVSEIQKAIHIRPDNFHLLSFMSILLNYTQHSESESTYQIAEQTQFHMNNFFQANSLHSKSEVWKGPQRHLDQLRIDINATVMCILAGKFNFSDVNSANQLAFTKASKLVHLHPYSKETWTLLYCAVDVKNYLNQFKKHVENNFEFDKILLNSDDKLTNWFKTLNIWQKSSEFDICGATTDSNFLSACQILYNLYTKKDFDFTKLKAFIENIKDAKELKHFGMLCKNIGVLNGAVKMFKKSAEMSNSENFKFNCYVMICHCALIGISQTESEAAYWEKELENYVSKMFSLRPNGEETILMQGLLLKWQKNYRKARSILNRCVYADHLPTSSTAIAVKHLHEVLSQRNDAEDLEKLNEFIKNNKNIAIMI